MQRLIAGLALAAFAGLAGAQADPAKPMFAAAGAEAQAQGPAEFAAFVKGDNERWAKLIRQRKMQLD